MAFTLVCIRAWISGGKEASACTTACVSSTSGAAPTGAGDAIVTQPNHNTGVFTACWNAWRSAPNTKNGRNNALEAIIDTPAVGILSAELAGT